MNSSLRLYHYWRSTSSWRVRWGLEIKGIKPELVAINLLTNDSDQPEHLARNPMGYVPVLEVSSQGKTHFLGESFAILEWLEETHPSPALLPKDPFMRAHTRMLCEIINSGTQPLGNLTVTEHLSTFVATFVERSVHGESAQTQVGSPVHPAANPAKPWIQHWVRKGLHAYETLAQKHAGHFSIGDEISMADIFLIPQCYAALRNEVALEEFPTVARIHKNALALPSAQASHPDRYQPQP